MLDLHHLETFRVVGKTMNFTKAAMILGYSQSSVTSHIQALEKELGTTLLERDRFSKSITLTEAGRSALEYANRLIGMANELITSVRRGTRSRN